jgi:DNA mismatch repair protein MutS
LPKLVRAGYRVAVCEQLEDPKLARGIVRRDVIEVVTPGVALYDKLLDTKRNNYVAAIYVKSDRGFKSVGMSCSDISTGEFFAGEFAYHSINEVLESLSPAEIIISKEQKNELLEKLEKLSSKPAITKLEPWIFDEEFGKQALLGHFKTQTLKGFGIENMTSAIASAGAVLHYIKETQKGQLAQIKKISAYYPEEFMTLDQSTRRNLEITYSFSDSSLSNSGDGSLISILDKTITSMGGRLFKKWLTRPLKQLASIQTRLEIVKSIYSIEFLRKELQNSLSHIGDLERLISKVCSNRANPRDIIALKQSLKQIPAIKEIAKKIANQTLIDLVNRLDNLNDMIVFIEHALVEEPSVQLGTGNVFNKNYSAELDEYVTAKFNSKKWLNDFQEKEREIHGIPTMKVSVNSVFGYYIEISKGQSNKAPSNYERKQTLTNAERYTTPELKEFEAKIFSAEEKILEIEQKLFAEILANIAEKTISIQDNAVIIATIDCLQSFAECAVQYNYCEPQIDNSEVLEIVEGRHPVVERLLPIGDKFTPNTTFMDTASEQIHILTGPNMSGKSCYLRQVALIILLGQIGCYVPAQSAKFGIVDRIFTRVGAQDNITSGESTFLVEMQEAANIMNNASTKSLLLLDEVGRGTATFDGISIAWAIAEHIHNAVKAKTLFATHYHELNDLAERYERIKNYQVEVVESEGTIIFSHKVKPGASDHSFGIHVAQMAGMPADVISRAYEIMKNFEDNQSEQIGLEVKTQSVNVNKVETKKSKRIPEQLSIFELKDDKIREKILSMDLNNITPIDALKILSDIYNEIKNDRD